MTRIDDAFIEYLVARGNYARAAWDAAKVRKPKNGDYWLNAGLSRPHKVTRSSKAMTRVTNAQ